MGNSSSLLTQYDLEDPQNKCNNLCETDTRPLSSSSSMFCFQEDEIWLLHGGGSLRFATRNNWSVWAVLSAGLHWQRLHMCGRVYGSPWVCSESLCQLCIWYDILAIFPILWNLFNPQDLMIREACYVMLCYVMLCYVAEVTEDAGRFKLASTSSLPFSLPLFHCRKSKTSLIVIVLSVMYPLWHERVIKCKCGTTVPRSLVIRSWRWFWSLSRMAVGMGESHCKTNRSVQWRRLFKEWNAYNVACYRWLSGEQKWLWVPRFRDSTWWLYIDGSQLLDGQNCKSSISGINITRVDPLSLLWFQWKDLSDCLKNQKFKIQFLAVQVLKLWFRWEINVCWEDYHYIFLYLDPRQRYFFATEGERHL
jgi:hypothetical protein